MRYRWQFVRRPSSHQFWRKRTEAVWGAENNNVSQIETDKRFWLHDRYCISVKSSRRRTCWAMVEVYDTGLWRIVDHNAPLFVKTVTLRPNSPWYTDELPRDNHYRQRAERTRLRTGLMVLRQVYRAQCMVVNRMLLAAKRNYYSDKISSCGSNQKQRFNITKSLMEVSCHA